MLRKGRILFPVVVLLIGLFSTAVAAQTLFIAKDQEAVVFDPHKVPAASSIAIFRHIYEGLATTDGDGNIIPVLAESWTIEDDTTYIFKLREGVKFTTAEMTSEDVSTATHHQSRTASIAASFFNNMEEILAPDLYTVVFKLKSEADFLTDQRQRSHLPQKWWKRTAISYRSAVNRLIVLTVGA